MDGGVGRSLKALPPVQHARMDVMGDGRADEVLSPSRGGDGTGAVVCPGSGADDRTVSNPSMSLVCHAAGRGARCQVSFRIEGDTSNGPEFFAGGVPFQSPQIAGVRFLGVEPALFCRFSPLLFRKSGCARPAEEDMFRAVHDFSRHCNGMAVALKPGDGTTIAVLAPHDAGVEFVDALGGVNGAASCIEQAVVFEQRNGGHDCIDSGSTLIENGASLLQRSLQGRPVGGLLGEGKLFGVEVPCTTVDRDGPGGLGGCGRVRVLRIRGLATYAHQQGNTDEDEKAHAGKVQTVDGHSECLILPS